MNQSEPQLVIFEGFARGVIRRVNEARNQRWRGSEKHTGMGKTTTEEHVEFYEAVQGGVTNYLTSARTGRMLVKDHHIWTDDVNLRIFKQKV